jgi:alkylation response protein AidB-like acyl-CoA dehydrogenase
MAAFYCLSKSVGLADVYITSGKQCPQQVQEHAQQSSRSRFDQSASQLCVRWAERSNSPYQDATVKPYLAAAHAAAAVVAGQIARALGGGGGRHGEISAAAEHLAGADSLCALSAYLSSPAAVGFDPDGQQHEQAGPL